MELLQTFVNLNNVSDIVHVVDGDLVLILQPQAAFQLCFERQTGDHTVCFKFLYLYLGAKFPLDWIQEFSDKAKMSQVYTFGKQGMLPEAVYLSQETKTQLGEKVKMVRFILDLRKYSKCIHGHIQPTNVGAEKKQFYYVFSGSPDDFVNML